MVAEIAYVDFRRVAVAEPELASGTPECRLFHIWHLLLDALSPKNRGQFERRYDPLGQWPAAPSYYSWNNGKLKELDDKLRVKMFQGLLIIDMDDVDGDEILPLLQSTIPSQSQGYFLRETNRPASPTVQPVKRFPQATETREDRANAFLKAMQLTENARSRTQASIDNRVLIIVRNPCCFVPPTKDYAIINDLPEFASIEDRQLVNEIALLLILQQAARALPTGGGVRAWPIELLNLPPSPWGQYSLRERLFRKTFSPLSTHSIAEPGEETQESDTIISQLGNVFLGSNPDVEVKKWAELALLHVLRVCRRLAVWNLEGRDFQCTFLLATQRNVALATFVDQCKPSADQLSIMCSPLFSIKESPRMILSDRGIRHLVGLAQEENLLMFVDFPTCQVRDIYTYKHLVGDVETCRIHAFPKLAAFKKGIVIHVRAGKFVEVYDHSRLRLWYDGYSWENDPYDKLDGCLSTRFRKENSESICKQITAAIAKLQDNHQSSIIMVVDDSEFEKLDMKNSDGSASYLRPFLRAASLCEAKAVSEIPLRALLGLLRCDGCHVINRNGIITHHGHRIIPAGQEGEGAGRAAAKTLSTEFPKSLVLKISSSGPVYGFIAGQSW